MRFFVLIKAVSNDRTSYQSLSFVLQLLFLSYIPLVVVQSRIKKFLSVGNVCWILAFEFRWILIEIHTFSCLLYKQANFVIYIRLKFIVPRNHFNFPLNGLRQFHFENYLKIPENSLIIVSKRRRELMDELLKNYTINLDNDISHLI